MNEETRAKLLEIAEEIERRRIAASERYEKADSFEMRAMMLGRYNEANEIAQLLIQHAGDREEASSQSEGAPAESPAPTCPECGAMRSDLDYWRVRDGYPGCQHPWHDREDS